MQGAWFILNFSKLLILYPRFEKTHRVKRLGEIRDAFQTLNPVKSEVWNKRATVSLVKFHFFSPEFRYHPQACAWQGREAHWGNPSSCFVTIHLSPWAHWCYGLADPCCPPTILKRCDLFYLRWASEKICLWTIEMRLPMFNCVLTCDYLIWHFFFPFLSKMRTTETHSNVLLGEKKLYSVLHPSSGKASLTEDHSLNSTALMLHSVASIAIFLWDERLYMIPASTPEKSMLPPLVIRTLTLKAPGVFSAPFPIAHASPKFSSRSSKSCLCSNCVLFLPASSCCPSRRRTVPRSQSVMILTLILAWR